MFPYVFDIRTVKDKKIILPLLGVIFLISCANQKKIDKPKGFFLPALIIIERHIQEGTKYDGPKCPYYPSCSAYGKRAIRDHSLMGFLMTMDRLFFRESGSYHQKYFVTPKRLSEHIRFYNPVSDDIPIYMEKHGSLYKDEF
ncbi:MAG: membrane protein insertion efficiency factor YidD [Leptospiraceae bacterium]|nr:membrane protein insertion efficiency factor YidD [Leptospiraceae bacterium]MCP5496279.1 membrane protein insertion efficiency factor YidD [Leptospiraceae bacterium]